MTQLMFDPMSVIQFCTFISDYPKSDAGESFTSIVGKLGKKHLEVTLELLSSE